MPPRGYLLDTNIVLHWTRDGSPVAAEVERQFQLASSAFKPLVCEVTLGEMQAFARGRSWGASRLSKLAEVAQRLTIVSIASQAIYEAYGILHSRAKAAGLPIQHDHNDLWIGAAAQVTGSTLLSTDAKAFLPLRDTKLLGVVVLNAQTGTALK
jgi:predicted nucleic acid-binding protein